MTTIAVSPFVLKDALFQVAADNYEAHVSQVQFDPSTSIQVWQGLTPAATFTDSSIATWQATLAYAQDWETPNSLSRYLYDNEGKTITAVFKPRAGSGPSFTVQLVITPGAIGGTVNAFTTATVTLGIKGRPVITPSAVSKTSWAVAITGTPTGGTYSLTFNGWTTAPLAYNATTAAVVAAINALSGVSGISTASITGGTAAAYTIVFPTAVTLSASGAFTGGTAPAIAVS
ncbi:hypothetical protein ACYX8G_14630 [Microbacterium saperdae]